MLAQYSIVLWRLPRRLASVVCPPKRLMTRAAGLRLSVTMCGHYNENFVS